MTANVNRMTGRDCAVMCDFIITHTNIASGSHPTDATEFLKILDIEYCSKNRREIVGRVSSRSVNSGDALYRGIEV